MEINTFSLELLTNDNYAVWSVNMKNNLLAQGLWDIVERGLKPPITDDDVVELEVWKKMNDAALHAIRSSCGMEILSRINKISSAKIAWETLAEMFMELRKVEQGHSCSSNISDSGQDMPAGSSRSVPRTVGELQRDELLKEGALPLPVGAIRLVDQFVPKRKKMGVHPRNIEGHRQDKLIDDDLIDEGDSLSSNNPGPEREDDYAALLKAVWNGNWNAIRQFLEIHPGALTARMSTFTGRTVLHHAVDAEQEYIVQKLVNMISEQDLPLTIKDSAGFTALHETCFSGNSRMAECLIKKNKELISIRNDDNELPVVMAMGCGHKDLAGYLYSETPFKDLYAEKHLQGASLLNRCIYTRDLGMALDLMERCSRLAFALDERGISPLEALGVSTEAFESGKGMVFWKQWIYNHCIPDISCARATDQCCLNIQNGQEKTMGSVRERLLVSSLSNLLGFKRLYERLYEMKLERAQFQHLLSLMCKVIPTNTSQSIRSKIITPAIFNSIRRGNFEFVYHIIKENSDLLLIGDVTKRRSIFHWAVLHRQHRIFNLIYNLKKKNALLNMVDSCENTILHMAGRLTQHTPIDHIRGAALQMQTEVQWFKEVESICQPLSCKEHLNKKRLTPRQLFTRDHQELRTKGEQWMKDTATSCSMVGALLVTVTFAAAFTVPGGSNQDTGLPILMHEKLFKIFIITNSLSLFSSTTSVLTFLGILTSRYAEEDFLISLPKKMIIGLFSLFFSIATMMIAFSAALLLVFREQSWIVVPVISLASVPIILFLLMQSRLLVAMLVSTYTPGIFNRKMKPWFEVLFPCSL